MATSLTIQKNLVKICFNIAAHVLATAISFSIRCACSVSSQLARIIPPAVYLAVGGWIPLLGEKQQPLLTCLLTKLVGCAFDCGPAACPGCLPQGQRYPREVEQVIQRGQFRSWQ